ncbi:STAS domain-containing protein [Paractinoplanes atraurantiacus]|uniref:STAS domain-containing protein n=1 Tax=Paractinoplanes atraurantiacus TaxID=1036182 RepID=A0A285GQI5_9ACTN|nr:STAS domain-containing protein [Actinoplanes atraurantiacus]SNY25494.1 STAS domain-containing protein [Actinoplanes atraurantiacus]
MAVTAVTYGQGPGVQVICDGCGGRALVDGGGLHDGHVVHVAVSSIGWTGSTFARGPHHCRRCSADGRTIARAGGDISVELRPAAAILRLFGDVGAGDTAALRTTLAGAASARRAVVVDLTETRTIHPAALAVFVDACTAGEPDHNTVVLAGPSRSVRTSLRLMRPHATFPTFGTVRQAVVAVSRADHRAAA